MNEFRNRAEFLEQLPAKDKQEKRSFTSYMKQVSAKAAAKGIPANGYFELTPLCNFDCKMCYSHLRKDQLQGRELLSVEQWKSLMHDAWEAGMLTANLTGGECLSYSGFKELYLYLRSLGVLVCILSNGALLNDEWVRFFEQHKPGQIMITLYGGNEETYERVTGQRKCAVVAENIRKLIDANIKVKIGITPSKYMGEDVFETIRFADSLGAPYIVNSLLFDPREETGRSGQTHDPQVDDQVRIFQFLGKLKGIETKEIDPEQLPLPGGPCHESDRTGIPCGAGRGSFTMKWDGTMIPCSSISDISSKPLEIGFSAAWKEIHRQCGQWPEIPECRGCPYETVCIKCPALRSRFAEPGKQPMELCMRTRYMVQKGVSVLPDCEETQS